MKVLTIILVIAITMAISTITLITKNTNNEEQKPPLNLIDDAPVKKPMPKPKPLKNVSRFLAQQEKSPRGADHCSSHHETCFLADKSKCCNNKCVDIKTDRQNCGKCKKKCEHTETCCNGKCVELAYNNHHCGSCDNRCHRNLRCIYGLCDYP